MNDENLRDTYNRIARDYNEDHKDDTWDDDYIQLFTDSLLENATVLDLGCGPGVDTAKLSSSGLSVEGFDLSDGLLEIAKGLNPGLTFTQGDMRKLPYEDEIFDGVFAKASLLHIPKSDIHLVLQEMHRVVKNGGLIHIAIKGGEGEKSLKEDDYGYEYSRFFSFWDMDSFEAELLKCGFSITKKDTYQKNRSGHTVWIKILAQRVN
jgi:ubiquinone/menaquinone biosynthesis C-methylase UbiE